MIDKLKRFYRFIKSLRWDIVDFIFRIEEVQGLLISFGITFILVVIVVIIVLVKML